MADSDSRSFVPPGTIERLSERDLEEKILRFRHLTGVWAVVYSVIAAFLTLSHLYTWGFEPRPLIRFLPLHLGLMFLIVFLLFPATRRWSEASPGEGLPAWKRRANHALAYVDVVLALVASYTAFYLFFNTDAIILRAGNPNEWDITVGTLGLILLAEAVRRAVGIPMVVLAATFVAYAVYGNRLSGPLRTRRFSWRLIVEQLWFGNEGVFDIPVQVAATYVIIFVSLGAFFKYTGVGEFFINVAYGLTGHRRGGPAKTSILASAFFGTVSGSSIANAVTTGAFTIPMMRKVGYRKEFAGAVEASASTGGQIMPPILGAAAFVMIEFLAIPYRTIVLAAVIPALCFFAGAWIMVHLEAKKRGLRSVPKSELPDVKVILKKHWAYLLPFALLFILLFSNTVSIFRAGIYTIIFTAAISFVRRETRLTPSRLRETFDEVGRNMAGVSMACAAAGVIGGIVKLTGFGTTVVLLISEWSFGYFFLALILTMIACLILGMGLPTTATYILVATIAAPAIVNYPGFVPPNGLSREVWTLAAHMFVLFYGVVADVTPPVALSAYAASGIAGGDQFKTGLEAFKISMNKFLVPFAFVYQPAILFLGVRWTDPWFMLDFVVDVGLLFVGIFFLHAGLSRFLVTSATRLEGAMFTLGGALFMFPEWRTDLVGLALAGTALAMHLARSRREDSAPTPLPDAD